MKKWHRDEFLLHGHKEVIDVAQDPFVSLALTVVLQTHTEHIEKNAYHDEDVKFLVRSQVEEESSNCKLEDEAISDFYRWSRSVQDWLEALAMLSWASYYPFFSSHCNTSSGRLSWTFLSSHRPLTEISSRMRLFTRDRVQCGYFAFLLIEIIDHHTDEKIQRKERSKDNEQNEINKDVDVGFVLWLNISLERMRTIDANL
jgi:hypothetical protein